MKDESLQEQLARLESKLGEARAVSLRGSDLANRIEGDLRRVMNSALLNCSELIDLEQRRNKIPPAFVAAVQFAQDDPRGMDFLRYLQLGDIESLRRGWPECNFDELLKDWAP